MKIALVGPVRPFRGGVAHHTSELHRTLSEQASLLTISFSRQYPKLLYPGISPTECPDSDGVYESGVEYSLDSLNPVTWMQTLRRIKAFSPDLAIIPWWHAYWAPCFGWLARQLRRSDIAVSFICHNITGHENTSLERYLSKFALRHADHYIVHSRQNASDLLRLFPSANIFVHPHPVPRSLPSPKNIFRRRSSTELLFFGFVRPYKGLDVLLNALVHLKDSDFYLTVAGEFWNASNEARDFVERHGLDGRVEIVARYVSDWEAAEYFARADAVVLPYIRATSSGVIPLAYYYDKPVIASRVGGLPDFVEEGGTGLLVHPGSPTDLARALSTIISNGGWYNINSITKMKQKLSWQSFRYVRLGRCHQIHRKTFLNGRIEHNRGV